MTLSTVTAQQITDRINLDVRPKKLVEISQLPLPRAFRSLRPQEFVNKFPFGRYCIASLHVASRYRGVNLQTIDFSFGGSTLGMLANKDASSPYMVTRVPHTDILLVVKCKEYVQNYADFGFQFERLVTGLSLSDKSDVEFVEHLHTMLIGTHRVLFSAETDALNGDEPVEVKSSNPIYWGSRVMFQMISSGSHQLCHGVKLRGALTGINILPLSEVARGAFQEQARATLEANILEGMLALKTQMNGAKNGEVFKICFANGDLRLLPVNTRSAILVPHADIVKQLLS